MKNSLNSLFGGYAFSGLGLILSLVSMLNTSGLCQLAIKARLEKIDVSVLPTRLKQKYSFSTVCNILGMFLTLISQEQIVGQLIGRSLTLQGLQPGVMFAQANQLVRPLDVFIIQANTNLLASHLISLATSLRLKSRLPN